MPCLLRFKKLARALDVAPVTPATSSTVGLASADAARQQLPRVGVQTADPETHQLRQRAGQYRLAPGRSDSIARANFSNA